MLPLSRRDFKNIVVVFELNDTGLPQVVMADDDLNQRVPSIISPSDASCSKIYSHRYDQKEH
jgi:hypothetical protein